MAVGALLLVIAHLNENSPPPDEERGSSHFPEPPSGPFRPFHPSADAVRTEIIKTVDQQLAAFRANDYAKAYGLASATFRRTFPLPSFEQLVKSRYPAIAQSKSAIFGGVFENGSAAIANVKLTSAVRSEAHYQYLMTHEESGWKVSGVVEFRRHHGGD